MDRGQQLMRRKLGVYERENLMTTWKLGRAAAITGLFAATVFASGTTAFGSVDLGTFAAAGKSPNDSASVAASADFVDLGGGQLEITLQNTYAGDVSQIGDVLYGVFFSGATLSTFVSGDAIAGSKIWTYPGSGNASYTTVGAGGAALTDPWGLDKVQNGPYGLIGANKEGLVSTGFSGTASDGLPNMQHQPFDESTAVFVVNYTGSISQISDVEFLYGTTAQLSSEIAGNITGNTVAVPEPATWAWLSATIALVPLGAERLRRLYRNRTAA